MGHACRLPATGRKQHAEQRETRGVEPRVSIGSPPSAKPEETISMNRVTHVARSMSSAADERSLGAEARVGLGTGRGQPAEEVRDAGARSR